METLNNLLLEHESSIVQKWKERVLSSYASETQKFLQSEKDQFANPVGQTIETAMMELGTQFIHQSPIKDLEPHLDSIIRIRAVQSFTVAEALSFVFSLKEIIREQCLVSDKQLWKEMITCEARIDELALAAFQIYLGCRVQICEIRVREQKRKSARLLMRLNEPRAGKKGKAGDKE